MRDALPADFWSSAELVQHGDPAGAELLIGFLEADPYYHRSGYLKADVLRWLGRIALDEAQKRRLRAVVLKVVALGWRREFRRYCAFAKRLDAPPFRRDLEALAASRDRDVSNRAKRVLNSLNGVASIWHEWQARQLMSPEQQTAALAKMQALTAASALELLKTYRHQMDLHDVRTQLEFIVYMGSAEAEELLRQLNAAPDGSES